MEPDIDEALRYLGAGRDAPEELRREAEEAARSLGAALRPRYCYKVFPLIHSGEGERLAGTEVLLPGRTVKTMLAQCGQAVLLACTLGARFDAMLRSEQARDMSRAVLLDACGSAWVEQGCGEAEGEIAARFPGQYLTDRFSPGYGDLPLTVQSALCAALDAPRRLGLHVTASLLLNPGKSVTAVIGLSDRPQMARVRGCAHCSMGETCSLRKGGKSCAL